MLEAIAERPPLPRRVLEQHHRRAAGASGERLADGGRDEAQPFVLAAGRARAGMDHDAEQPERLGAIELVDERLDRLPPQRVERGRQIDQIARV
jgi:hypothetical protein